MKKYFCALMGAILICSAFVSSASAAVMPKFNEDGTHYEYTEKIVDPDAIIEEYNRGGTIADLVRFTRYLHRRDNGIFENFQFDYNYDGKVDVFDLIILRKAVLFPENAFKQTYACDVLKTAEKSNEIGAFVNSAEELEKYLSELGTDKDEIKEYQKIYDSKYFEKNTLVLATVEQDTGYGIYHIPNRSGFVPLAAFVEDEGVDNVELQLFLDMIGKDRSNYRSANVFWIITSSRYTHHHMTYPKNKSILLMQVNVPKSANEVQDKVVITSDFDIFGPDYDSITYESYDKKRKIVVYTTDDSFMDPDYGFQIYYIDENGEEFDIGGISNTYYLPFSKEGEWSVNDEGEHIFSNNFEYRGNSDFDAFFKIKWAENSVEVRCGCTYPRHDYFVCSYPYQDYSEP